MNRIASSFAMAFFALTSLVATTASAATYINGDITTSTTWDAAGSPYIVQKAIRVKAPATLTIQNATVQFSNSMIALRTIDVLSGAALNASGSLFTSIEDSAPGQWTGIRYASGAVPSVIDACEFRHGGWGSSANAYGPVTVAKAELSIWDSYFHDNQRSGLSAFESTLYVYGSSFVNNQVGISANMAHLTLENSLVQNNPTGLWFNYTTTYALARSWLQGNEIVDNGLVGITFKSSQVRVDATGNVIARNGNLETKNQIFTYYTFTDAMWSDNQFGDLQTLGATKVCDCYFAMGPIRKHRAYVDSDCITKNEAPPEGAVTSDLWSFPLDSQTMLFCRTDHLDTF